MRIVTLVECLAGGNTTHILGKEEKKETNQFNERVKLFHFVCEMKNINLNFTSLLESWKSKGNIQNDGELCM